MKTSLRNLEKASQKLFRDAIKEESTQSTQSTQSHNKPLRLSKLATDAASKDAWDGDEHPHDTSLRMLLDARKPLRGGDKNPYREGRLKTVQQPAQPSQPSHLENLIPSDPNYMPWHAEYVYPSHASGSSAAPSIYRARKLESQALEKVQHMEVDSKTKAMIRDTKRSKTKVRRLVNAREGALDYSLAGSLDEIENTNETKERHRVQSQTRPRPQSLKAWNSLVEEQIEDAHRKGQFKNLNGRGKPLASVSQGNAFISREEFLMNRLINQQGAVPPFVELQMTMQSEVMSFCNYLREEYVKRGARYLDRNATEDSVRRWRDVDWENRQKSYHTILIDRVNSAIKSYNAIAPPFSRRGLLLLDREVENARLSAVPLIVASLAGDGKSVETAPGSAAPAKSDTWLGRVRALFGGL